MNRNKIKALLLLIFLSIVWGSSFILIKKGLIGYSAGQVGALRIVFSGLIFLPILAIKLRKVKIQKPGYNLLFGLLEIGIPPFLFALAETVVSSSTAGILNSLVPLFTLVSGAILFKVKTGISKIAGVIVGLVGALMLVLFRSGLNFEPGNFADAASIYGLLVLIAGMMYGLGGNILKEKLHDVDDVMITAVAFTSMAIPAGIYLLTTDIFSIPLSNPVNLQSFISIFILSSVNSALAIYLFSKLTKMSSALFASFCTYLMPFVAIFWGVVDGEAFYIIHFIGMTIIFIGIYIANKDSFKGLKKG